MQCLGREVQRTSPKKKISRAQSYTTALTSSIDRFSRQLQSLMDFRDDSLMASREGFLRAMEGKLKRGKKSSYPETENSSVLKNQSLSRSGNRNYSFRRLFANHRRFKHLFSDSG